MCDSGLSFSKIFLWGEGGDGGTNVTQMVSKMHTPVRTLPLI